MANRISFFVDGFNLYHSIKAAQKVKKISRGKWFDLSAFCLESAHRHDSNSTVVQIFYFSAFARHVRDIDAPRRHDVLLQAFRANGIRTIMGNFKRKQVRCHHCSEQSTHFEEKETDVNIAVYLLESLVRDECDTAIIISGDTDLCAALRAAKRMSPTKKVGLAFPYARSNEELRQAADFSFKIDPHDYERFVLPNQVTVDGGFVVEKPHNW